MKNCAFIFDLAVAISASTLPSVSLDSFASLRSIIQKTLGDLEEVDQLIESQRNSSEVIGKIIGKGWESISQTTNVRKLSNLRRENFDWFVEVTMNLMGVPPSDTKEIKEKVFAKLKDDTEPGQWVEHKMLFNPSNDPDNTKCVCFYGYVRENRNFDLVTLEVKASFKLAKNLLIIHNKLTGKITLEAEKLETERVPSGEVGKDDIQVLLKFLDATAVRILSNKLA